MIPPAVNPRLQERPREFYQLVHIGNRLRVADDRHTPPCAQVWIQLISLERHDEIVDGGGQLGPAGNPDHHVVAPQPEVHRLRHCHVICGCIRSTTETRWGSEGVRVNELKSPDKPFEISKWAVQEAWEKVKANKGAPGVDGVWIEGFEADLHNNLYKVWNRMSSGSYFPPPVRAVEIPKPHGGGTRMLGVPTEAA